MSIFFHTRPQYYCSELDDIEVVAIDPEMGIVARYGIHIQGERGEGYFASGCLDFLQLNGSDYPVQLDMWNTPDTILNGSRNDESDYLSGIASATLRRAVDKLVAASSATKTPIKHDVDTCDCCLVDMLPIAENLGYRRNGTSAVRNF